MRRWCTRSAPTASIYDPGSRRLSRQKPGAARPRAGSSRQGFTDDAGRAAHLAGFHAAQALISEKLGRSPKIHSACNRLSLITKDEPSLEREMRTFLGRTYNLKAIVEYGTARGSRVTHDASHGSHKCGPSLCRRNYQPARRRVNNSRRCRSPPRLTRQRSSSTAGE